MNRKLFAGLTQAGLCATGFCLISEAQGTAFTYQGQLSSSNQPANGNYDPTFSLFDAATSGNQVGCTATNLAVGVTNGLFTTTVSFGPGIFTGASYWLPIGVKTNGAGGHPGIIRNSKREVRSEKPEIRNWKLENEVTQKNAEIADLNTRLERLE